MKAHYTRSCEVQIPIDMTDWDAGNKIRRYIETTRDELVRELEADGADPRDYRWTVTFPKVRKGHRFEMTADRLPWR